MSQAWTIEDRLAKEGDLVLRRGDGEPSVIVRASTRWTHGEQGLTTEGGHPAARELAERIAGAVR